MFVVLLICFLVLAVALDVMSVWMKIRVNEQLPEERRLTWWSRNYSQVNKLYEQQNPDSFLLDLNRGFTFLVVAFFAVTIVVGIAVWK